MDEQQRQAIQNAAQGTITDDELWAELFGRAHVDAIRKLLYECELARLFEPIEEARIAFLREHVSEEAADAWANRRSIS